jgi:hypothetical protein
MADHTPESSTTERSATGPAERTDDETRARVVRLAFGGDEGRYRQFVQALREAVPPDVTVVLRGSAVTGTRWEDGAPFDADGAGTSDLDLTLVGGGMVRHFDVFYIPGLHTAPLSDEHPDASLTFIPLRKELSTIARRPVNIQATADLVQYLRDVTMNQPYFTVIERDPDVGAS